MALIKCIECGQMVSDRAKACPHCGYPLASNNAYPHQEGPEQEYYYDFDDEDHSNYKTLWIILISILASVAIVGIYLGFFNHKTESLETVEEETILAEPTIETVTDDLMKLVDAKDEASAVAYLDGLKKTAEDFLAAGDNNKYFSIINIIKTVWETNKDRILESFPNFTEKMESFIYVPEVLKDDFAEFVSANGGYVSNAEVAASEVESSSPDNSDMENASVSSSDPAIDRWLNGRWVYSTIDPTLLEVYEEVFTFRNGYYSFGCGSERTFHSVGDSYKYHVKGDIIYTYADAPLLLIDRSGNRLIDPNDSEKVFKKI